MPAIIPKPAVLPVIRFEVLVVLLSSAVPIGSQPVVEKVAGVLVTKVADGMFKRAKPKFTADELPVCRKFQPEAKETVMSSTPTVEAVPAVVWTTVIEFPEYGNAEGPELQLPVQ